MRALLPVLILLLAVAGLRANLGESRAGDSEQVTASHYPDGTMKTRTEYEDGQRHGLSQSWYPGGELRYEGRYRHGLREGEWHFRNEDGSLDRERSGRYRDGERVAN